MVKIRAESRALVPISHSPDTLSPLRFRRSGISPGFITQLIAIKMDVDAYRVRRRLEPAEAIKAYDAARALASQGGAAVAGGIRL